MRMQNYLCCWNRSAYYKCQLSCSQWLRLHILTSSDLGLRATSHMSQEAWPCNGEDPWLSSKGRTMGVGKAILCSHMSSSIVWSENGPCCRTIAYFVSRKRGEDLVQYNMSQTLSIRENYFVMFVYHRIYPRIYYEIYLAIYHEICPVGKNILKNGLPEFTSSPPLGGGLDEYSIDHETSSIVHHVGLYVDFSSMKSFLTFRPSHSCVKWSWTVSAFQPMRALKLQCSRAFNLHSCVWSGP